MTLRSQFESTGIHRTIAHGTGDSMMIAFESQPGNYGGAQLARFLLFFMSVFGSGQLSGF